MASKKLRSLLIVVTMAVVSSISLNSYATDSPDIWKELGNYAKEELKSELRNSGRSAVNEAKYKARQGIRKGIRNGLSKSGISSSKGKKKTVKIEKFPETVDEFVTICEDLATTPEGTVAMQVIALGMCSEIDYETGIECMDLINTSTGLTGFDRSRLSDWYRDGTDDPRPYQAAAFMKGAKPENGYNPSKPLTMVMYVSDIEEDDDGDRVTVRLEYSGSEVSKDIKITLIRPEDDDYFYIESNSSMYMKIKKKKRGTTYNGLR